MISSGLKKLAQANSLKVSNSVAYGFLRGYCATLSDGNGVKNLILSTRFADDSARYAFTQHLQNLKLDKEYKLNVLDIQEKIIKIEFTDSIGVMKRMETFIEVFFPLLDQYGASRSNICSECGMMLSGGSWKLVNGIAVYVHQACGEKIRATIEGDKETRTSTGSYARGALGALVGALGGSVVWAVVLMITGRIYALIGLLIGFLAEKCYNLFGGKKAWGKMAILILAVILGVLAGNLASEVIYVVRELGYSVGDSISFVFEFIAKDGEYRSVVLKNFLLGLLFAGLGVFGIMKATKDEITGPKVIDLE